MPGGGPVGSPHNRPNPSGRSNAYFRFDASDKLT